MLYCDPLALAAFGNGRCFCATCVWEVRLVRRETGWVVSRLAKVFRNSGGGLRNGWWVAVSLVLLAAVLFPAILVSAHFHHQLTLVDQAAMIAVVTAICQGMRRRSLFEVTGPVGSNWAGWFVELGVGVVAGALLMGVPALCLLGSGSVRWSPGTAAFGTWLSEVGTMAAVAVAEELLFRGFLFQRLIAGLGAWPAQLIVGVFFLLTHLNNPGMAGATKLWAGTNIFLASILFGLVYLRTRGLALPVGLHFMANVMEGPVLGMGVSGNDAAGLMTPSFFARPEWWTGGAFGLEASLPGLVCVVVGIALLLCLPSRPFLLPEGPAACA
jgi:uncharacterized protein